jgi:hypothetical protein
MIGTAAWLSAKVDGESGRTGRGRRRSIMVGLLLGLAGAIAGLTSEVAQSNSIRSVVIRSSGVWLEPAASGPVGGLIGTLLAGLAIGTAGAVVGWLMNGGAAWLQQLLIQALLARRKIIPADFASFLVHAHEHRLLVRTEGGGLGFEHEYMRDHLAASATAER